MQFLVDSIIEAFNLISQLDPELISITKVTFKITGAGLILAMIIGLPIGIHIGLKKNMPFSGCLYPLIFTGMGLPPVIVGLFTFMMLSNQGPFGKLDWLFTPNAMILGQAIISFPLIVGLTIAAIKTLDPQLSIQLKALGASQIQLVLTLLTEARMGIYAAIITAFGAIISEVGAVILVGGNIEGETRVLTTAIVLETRKGNFSVAMALGIILLSLAFLANYLLYRFQSIGDIE